MMRKIKKTVAQLGSHRQKKTPPEVTMTENASSRAYTEVTITRPNLTDTTNTGPVDNQIIIVNDKSIDMSKSQYEFVREIGLGSFGKAILVKKRVGGQQFVMKRINMNEMSEDERQGAMNEVKVLQLLKHRNIISYHESFQSDDGYLNIIMDYADGGDMFQKIRNAGCRWFDEDQIVDWFIQIALGLKHVHDSNILHRDLKTQNIFLTSDNTVKLGDFGIAKILNSQTEFANTVIGTPYYLSPELCEDKPYNQKSDVWALGCVLYEVTTLKHAFNGQNLPALVLKIVRGRYPPIPPQYSNDLKELISSMLQKDPDLRPSMEEILSQPFIQKRISNFIISLNSSGLKKKSETTAINNELKAVVTAPSNEIESTEKKDIQNKKDNEWLELKQKELMSMYKNLHPSKKFALDATPERVTATEERKQLMNERKKQRMRYYGQRLAERKNSTVNPTTINSSESTTTQEVVQPTPIVQQKPPSRVPKIQAQRLDPSPPRPLVSEHNPFLSNREQVVAKKVSGQNDEENSKNERIRKQQEARNLKQQIEEESKLTDARSRLEKKQEEKERGRWLSQMKENDINERKRRYLEEKKLEKQKRQEEERKKKLDHQKKMKAIKDRKKQLNTNISSDTGTDTTDSTTIPASNEIFILKKVDHEKDSPVDPQKEEERKKTQQQHRQDLKAFIMAQKKKGKADVSVDVVVPTSPRYINSSPKVMKEWDSVFEVKELQDNSKEPETSLVIEEEVVSRIPTTNDKVCEEDSMTDLTSDNNEVQEEPQPLLKQSELESKKDDIVRYLLEHNLQLNAPLHQTIVQDKQQKLSIRIEHLREYCEKKFGEELFLKLYKHLRDVGENDDDDKVDEGLHRVLGEDASRLYPYIQKVHQLIFCEDIFYAH